MTAVNQGADMAIPADELNDIDRWILDFLTEHEWATPNLIRAFYCDHLADDDSTEKDSVSRQYISGRLSKLRAGDHIERAHDDAHEVRLVDDPRDGDQ